MSDSPGVIDLTVDDDKPVLIGGESDEDEELKLAIALSLQDQEKPRVEDATATASRQPSTAGLQPQSGSMVKGNPSSIVTAANNPTGGLAGLNRQQMESERLARLKRKRDTDSNVARSISPPPLRRFVQPITTQAKPHQGLVNQATKDSTQIKSLPYLQGKVFLTSLDRSRSGSESVSLSDLLQPPSSGMTLKSALLSTFISDFDWLFPHFQTRSVSFLLVLHAAGSDQKSLLAADFAEIPNVRLVFPDTSGVVNCMHSKLMILFYEGAADRSCRIVVPTANLTPADWGVHAVMENTMFVIDLPSTESTVQRPTDTMFKRELMSMLKAKGVPNNVIAKLDQFNFNHTAHIGFVHSVGGSHSLVVQPPIPSTLDFFQAQKKIQKSTTVSSEPLESLRTGLHCLSDTITSLGLDVADDQQMPRLDFITSSLGNLKTSFLQGLILACCGRAPTVPIRTTTGTAKSKLAAKFPQTGILPDKTTIKKNLRIYFPSDVTVKRSKGGPATAGTICFQSKWWDENTSGDFPRDCLRDCIGHRGDLILMHSKILYVRYAEPKVSAHIDPGRLQPGRIDATIGSKKNNISLAGWVYIGSANLSESAWGAIVTDSRTKQPKINCRNWESGVILPVPISDTVRQALDVGQSLHDMTLREVFGQTIPVPIQEPADSYEDGRKPWFFMD